MGVAREKNTVRADVLSEKQTPSAELVTPIHQLKNIKSHLKQAL